MKVKRFKFGYRKSASSLHRKVGECIRSSPILSGYQIYQEYPVNRINSLFDGTREKFDWVIADLHIVIEAHGIQHYIPQKFGGNESKETTNQKFREQQIRDSEKKDACTSVGWTYISIPYTDEDKISEEYIINLIEKNKNAYPLVNTKRLSTAINYKQVYKERKESEEQSGRAEQQRLQAREYRKQQYERRKRWLKNRDNGGTEHDKISNE